MPRCRRSSSVAGSGAPAARRRASSRQAFMSCGGTLPSCRVYSAERYTSVARPDPFGARASLGAGLPDFWRLAALGDRIDLERAPITVKILLENTLRNAGGGLIDASDVETLAAWRPGTTTDAE